MAVRYGRYEVLYKLGQGAMAQVFLAKDPVLSRFVAVKVLHADLAARRDVLQRFFNEARTVAVVRNPHVVEVFDFGQEGKDLYLVMEFVDGLSLHGLLRQTGRDQGGSEPWAAPGRGSAPVYEPLDPTVAAALICQAVEGLSQAARHGVVHRDIKPENLMINQQGYLKISDFGIAHVQDDSLTKTGAVLGSPLYMSPEQARGLKPITSQADMFSLGAVFYACLAGHPPFQGRTVTELFRRIASEPHAPLWRLRPELDPALGNLVDTLLQKRPEDRGAGPRWLHRQLKGYLMALGVMDPAELVAGYVRELTARGVRTTWKGDARNATLPMTVAATERATGSRPERTRAASFHPPGKLPAASLPVAGSRPERESARPIPSAAVGLTLAALALGAGMGVWGWISLERAHRSNIDVTLAALGNPGAGRANASDRGNGKDTPADPRRGGGGEPAGADRPGPVKGESVAADTPGPNAVSPETASDPAAAWSVPIADSAPVPGAKAGEGGPKEADASLVLKSSPPFAEAYVDGRFVGVTPVRIDPLASGSHRVAMKARRLPGLDTVVTLAPGPHALKFHLEAGQPTRVAVTPIDGD
jgi:serine/threonine-protein kinase